MYARPLRTLISSVALGAILTASGLLGGASVPVAGFTASAGLLLAIYGVLQYADHRSAVKLEARIDRPDVPSAQFVISSQGASLGPIEGVESREDSDRLVNKLLGGGDAGQRGSDRASVRGDRAGQG